MIPFWRLFLAVLLGVCLTLGSGLGCGFIAWPLVFGGQRLDGGSMVMIFASMTVGLSLALTCLLHLAQRRTRWKR